MKTTKILISTILALTLFLSGCSSTHNPQNKRNEESLDTIEVDVEADSKTILTPAPNRQTSQSEVYPHPDITIEDIYRANLRETLLVNSPVIHTTIRLSDHSQQIDMYFTQDAYFEQQTQFWPQATRQVNLLFTEKDTCQKFVFGEGEEEFSIVGFFMSAQDIKKDPRQLRRLSTGTSNNAA